MRAITDANELACEFTLHGRTYRLILPHGKPRFSLDKLTRDEYRRWIWRWVPCGLGTYVGLDPRVAVTTAGRLLSPRLTSRIASALHYAFEGPASAKGGLSHG